MEKAITIGFKGWPAICAVERGLSVAIGNSLVARATIFLAVPFRGCKLRRRWQRHRIARRRVWPFFVANELQMMNVKRLGRALLAEASGRRRGTYGRAPGARAFSFVLALGA